MAAAHPKFHIFQYHVKFNLISRYISGPRTRYLLLSSSTSLRILTLIYFDSTQTFHFVLYVLPTQRVEPESSAFSDYAGDRADSGLGPHLSTFCGERALPITSLRSFPDCLFGKGSTYSYGFSITDSRTYAVIVLFVCTGPAHYVTFVLCLLPPRQSTPSFGFLASDPGDSSQTELSISLLCFTDHLLSRVLVVIARAGIVAARLGAHTGTTWTHPLSTYGQPFSSTVEPTARGVGFPLLASS